MSQDDPESTVSDNLKRITGTAGDRPFSVRAYEVFKARIEEYIEDLVTESARIARRSRADDISATHVQHAAEHLTSSRRGRFLRHVGTVGGIMLGGALSNILSMTLENRFGASGVLITTGVAIFGAALVTAHIVND